MGSETTVEVRDNPEESRFEAYVDGALAGFSAYVVGGDTVNFVHTEVDDAYEGQGVGGALARQVLDQALAAGLDVRVTCPFLTSWIGRHPEYADKVTLG